MDFMNGMIEIDMISLKFRNNIVVDIDIMRGFGKAFYR